MQILNPQPDRPRMSKPQQQAMFPKINKPIKRLICALHILVSPIPVLAENLPGEEALLTAVEEGLEAQKVETILSLYDFTDAHQIYRDWEAFTWKEIIALIKEGAAIEKVAIESVEETDDDMKATAEVREFEGRFHGPNIEPSGFLVIELDDTLASFVVGISKGGVLRIASTKVTAEKPKGIGTVIPKAGSGRSEEPHVAPADLKLMIQGFWIPEVHSFAKEEAKKAAKGSPPEAYREILRNIRPLIKAMVGNVAMKIDKDTIVTVNLSSGAPNSETVGYKHLGTDPATNSVRIEIKRQGKPAEQTLTIGKDSLTIAEGDSLLKYDRVDEAEFEKRRLMPGL